MRARQRHRIQRKKAGNPISCVSRAVPYKRYGSNGTLVTLGHTLRALMLTSLTGARVLMLVALSSTALHAQKESYIDQCASDFDDLFGQPSCARYKVTPQGSITDLQATGYAINRICKT